MKIAGQRRTPDGPVRTAVYCRISLSRFGDTVKVDDQERLSRDVAAHRGWTVVDQHVYKDNSVSAWRRGVRRPGWEAMLAAIERNEVDAIVVYHGDRLIRQPWDLEILLRLADERHIELASTTGSRDLSSEDDRFILRIEAAAACREVAATSRRMKRMNERRAEEGRTRLGGRGGRAFGFEPDGMTVRESDAEMLREAAQRILDGESVGAICRDLNDRGYRTTPGNEWSHGSLKRLMLRPRVAGLLARFGRVVGPAAWPAILDRDVWEAVVIRLGDKQQTFGYTTNVARYLLTGIARCGTCGEPMVIRHNTRSESLRGYGCINKACARKAHRSVHHLDPYVESAVIKLLGDPRVKQEMTPRSAQPLVDELTKLEARRKLRSAELEAQLADADADAPVDILRGAMRRIDKRMDELRAEIARASGTHVLDGLWGITLEGFRALPLSRRRSAVRVLLDVTVLPTGRRGPGFDPESVKLERPGPAAT